VLKGKKNNDVGHRHAPTVETNGRWLNLQVLVEIGNQMYKITAILDDTVKCRCVVESVWLCDWCKIYGKHPLEKCWHLASEPKVKTAKHVLQIGRRRKRSNEMS